MIAQGILSNPMGTAKALAGAHPIGLGLIVGIGAYYVVNKYWLNDNDGATTSIEGEEEVTEEVVEETDSARAAA